MKTAVFVVTVMVLPLQHLVCSRYEEVKNVPFIIEPLISHRNSRSPMTSPQIKLTFREANLPKEKILENAKNSISWLRRGTSDTVSQARKDAEQLVHETLHNTLLSFIKPDHLM